MDFRGPQQTESPKPNVQQHTRTEMPKSRLKNTTSSVFYTISQSILLIAVAVVLVGLLVFLAWGNSTNDGQSKFIDSNNLQAVFLNSGQVYFGNIKIVNSSYFDLTNIFYLQSKSNTATTSSTSASNVTLVKLGCELHAPLDQMIINTSQVSFWENLSPNGQVAKAVATFEKQNPHGQTCSSPTAGTPQTTTPTTSNSSSTVKP